MSTEQPQGAAAAAVQVPPEVQAAINAAVAQAFAALPVPRAVPVAVPTASGVVPCCVVQPPKGHARELEAGVVEKLERDESGAEVAVVKMDRDGALERFPAAELRVLLPHG